MRPESSTVKHARPSTLADRPPSRTPGHRLTHPRWAFIGLLVCVALAVPVLALAWSALRAPDALQRTETTGSVDYGIGLDYTFSGDRSTVYPSGTVDATTNAGGAVLANGPLYSRLLDRLDVTLAFRATEDGAERLTSTYTVEVDVSTPGGWATTIQTIDGERFRREATETVSVDLRDVARRVQAVGELTGVGGDSYTIEVQPELTVTAVTDSSPVDDSIRTPMTFTVEGNLITADAVEASESTPLTRNVTERAVYAVGPLEMRTQPARAVLSGLSLVLVAGIVWFASVLFGVSDCSSRTASRPATDRRSSTWPRPPHRPARS